MALNTSVFQYARSGVLWSLLQVWVNRIFTLLLWIILARLLSPQDFGIAAAGALLLQLVPHIADLGFGRAILQRPELKDQDINLPFAVSLVMAILLASVVAANAQTISGWVSAPEAALYLAGAMGTLALNVPNRFQRAVYQRHMRFKAVAIRTFYGNIIGGTAAVISAFMGAGYWAFLIQIYVTLLINAIGLWGWPMWWPSRETDRRSFSEMLRFGLPLAGQSTVAFFGLRAIDLVIISKFGLVAYGFYSVGSRLFQVFTQLFQTALRDVSISALSRISDDTERMQAVYHKTLRLMIYVVAGCFTLCASIGPEITIVLFGDRWEEAGEIARILLLLGGLNCVYFISAPFNAARGNSMPTLITGVVRVAVTLAALLVVPTNSVLELTVVFAVAFISPLPLAFYFVARDLKLPHVTAYQTIAPGVVINLVCFGAITALRPWAEQALGLPLWLQGPLLAAIFGVLYLGAMRVFVPDMLATVGQQLKSLLKKSPKSPKSGQGSKGGPSDTSGSDS